MSPEVFFSVFFSLSFWFFCWEGDFFLQEARFYFWQRDSFFVFIDRPQECIISIPSICNMQNIAHCLNFKKLFLLNMVSNGHKEKSALTENKLLSYIRNNTSVSTSARFLNENFSSKNWNVNSSYKDEYFNGPGRLLTHSLGIIYQLDFTVASSGRKARKNTLLSFKRQKRTQLLKWHFRCYRCLNFRLKVSRYLFDSNQVCFYNV